MKKELYFEKIDLNEILTYAKEYVPDKHQESYHLTYRHFLKFFQNKDTMTAQDIIIGMSFTYSWMPTMLSIYSDEGNLELLLPYFNKAKKGEELSVEEIDKLKSAINNSVVGLSKLLHFINPLAFPIWDSRVFRYLFGRLSDKISEPSSYFAYREFMYEVVKDPLVSVITEEMSQKLKYKITGIRSLEFCMYGLDVQKMKEAA